MNNVCVAIAAAVMLAGVAAADDGVPYPEGYRKWVHVKTVQVGPGSPFFQDSGGIHHIYANEGAVAGYKTHQFPDGSVLVFDLLDAHTESGVTVDGPRRRVDVMLKDQRRFAATGGWGFARFAGDTRSNVATADLVAQCVACHQKLKDRDLVFSDLAQG